MASDPPPEGYHFFVLDLNPVNVKKMQLSLKEKREMGKNETGMGGGLRHRSRYARYDPVSRCGG